MKKIIAIALVMMMCFALVACGGGGGEKGIVGEWKMSCNYANFLVAGLDGSMEGIEDYIDMDKIVMEDCFILEFEEDGDFGFEVDEDAVEESMYDIIDVVVDGMVEYLDEEMGVSLDALGMTEESVREMMEQSMDLSSLSDIDYEGEYKLEGEELTLITNGVEEKAEFELKGGELSIEIAAGGMEMELYGERA